MAHLSNAVQSVTLGLPAGERYRLELSSEDLAALLAPGRRPPRERGMSPIRVELGHPGGRAAILVSPGELTRLLNRARLDADAGQGPRVLQKPVHDPRFP